MRTKDVARALRLQDAANSRKNEIMLPGEISGYPGIILKNPDQAERALHVAATLVADHRTDMIPDDVLRHKVRDELLESFEELKYLMLSNKLSRQEKQRVEQRACSLLREASTVYHLQQEEKEIIVFDRTNPTDR